MKYSSELERFRRYLESRVQPGTVHAYTYALGKWFDRLDGNKPTQQTAQDYVDLIAKTKSASTANLRAHAIMRYFRWKGESIRLDCPTVRIGDIKYLSMEQFDKVLAACETEIEHVLVVVLFDTAVRISELLGITLDDVNWEHGLISVVRKGGRKQEVNISSKGLSALRSWLNARESKSKEVFMGLDYYNAWGIIKGIGKRTGIDLRPHIFRHTRAIQMLMSGADLHDVQGHLGHANITTTANIYGRFRALDLKSKIPKW